MTDIIIALIDGIPQEIKTLLLIAISFGVYKGFLKLPFVNMPTNKNKPCLGSSCSAISKHIKIWKIKTQETIYEQLSLAENTNDNITMYMIDLYSELTNDIIDIETYKDIVTLLEYEVRGKQKKWFKENHFTEKPEEIFRLYVEDRIKDILKIVSTTLNRKKSQFKVDRDILIEHNTKFLIPYAVEEFTKMFYAVREISRKKEQEILTIEGELYK